MCFPHGPRCSMATDALSTPHCRFLTLAGHRRAADNPQTRAMSSVHRLRDQKRATVSGRPRTVLQPQRMRIPGILAAIGPLPSLRNGHSLVCTSCDTAGRLTCMVTGVTCPGLACGLRLRWIRGQNRFSAGGIFKFGHFVLGSSFHLVGFFSLLPLQIIVLSANCFFFFFFF